MDNFPFIPLVDIPLSIGALAIFLFYYRLWSKSTAKKLEVDLQARLPQAMFRTTVFFIGLLTICWLSNFGVWAFLVLALVLGLIGTFLIGAAGPFDSAIFIGVFAVALREWSFGFPSLVLDIPSKKTNPAPATRSHELTGTTGITVGPLKPAGYARINDTEMPVVTDNGLMVDNGVEVVVTGFRNGSLRVKIFGGDS